ncbi:MAG: FAD-dependent oxidoreductase [Candidatus Hodgkinia cicadicola]|nr:MAG: FAD-dependent oxidoreductase [Candidatus Hodgkinia cicadicola]
MGNSTTAADVLIIGCGHAGLEAANAASKLGVKTAVITARESDVGKLACNPSIGGISKSHLICELSCLGGIIGKIADQTAIVAQTLNASKGKAVQSLRLQIDSSLYKLASAKALAEAGVLLSYHSVENIACSSEGFTVTLDSFAKIKAKTIILAVGTSVRSICHIGECALPLNRLDSKTTDAVYKFLKARGVSINRFKTGTSPRLAKQSISWSTSYANQFNRHEYGFCKRLNHSILTMEVVATLVQTTVCNLIKLNSNKSSLHRGRLLARGPKHCMSIEDRVLKFDHKPQKLVIEPEGASADSAYVNGMSTSVPLEVQLLALKLIASFKDAKVLKPGYAVEYDVISSKEVKTTLELAAVPNAFTAGQINGTTGYEEAGVQGYIAGVNAAQKVRAKREYVFDKHFSYVGVLVNDIATTRISEPYRMLTARSRNRTQLRQRNTVFRLIPYSLSVNVLPRFKEAKQVRWISTSKAFSKKLCISSETSLSNLGVGVQILKLKTAGSKAWNKVAGAEVGKRGYSK